MKLYYILLVLDYLSSFLLLIGIGLGLYTRWNYEHSSAVLCLAVIGLFVFILSFAAQYYFSLEHLDVFSHLWFGCLLGFIALTEIPQKSNHHVEEIMAVLFVTSLCVYFGFSFIKRVLKQESKDIVLLNYTDFFELVGMCIATTLVGSDFFSLALLVVAFGILIIAVRLKCLLSFPIFIGLTLFTHYLIFPMLHVTPNPYALVCFVGQRIIEPMLDLFFSSHNKLELWQRFIFQHQFWHKINILIIIVLELFFYVTCTIILSTYSEWYMIVCFVLFSIIWFCFHISLIITLWSLSQQIAGSNKLSSPIVEQTSKIVRILASRGLKHFSLISKNHVFISALTTVILSGLCWTKTTEIIVSIAIIVFTVEILIFDLLHELGSVLGGTAIICSLIVPSVPVSSNQHFGFVPPDILPIINDSMTAILKNVHLFISYHLLSNFGCDFSTSGMTFENLQTKLKTFFSQKIQDERPYDTYIVYYCGPVLENGDWALIDGKSISLHMLLSFWMNSINHSESRLIFIIDSIHSCNWIPLIKSLRYDSTFGSSRIALQAVKVNRSALELGNTDGNFTSEWVAFNCSEDLTNSYQGDIVGLKAKYAVTWHWTDFSVRHPSWNDINHHIEKYFPKFTHFFLKTMNWSLTCDCWCIKTCVHWIKSYKMLYFPPKELDTGHGFKLIWS